jgi:hypothetical protein
MSNYMALELATARLATAIGNAEPAEVVKDIVAEIAALADALSVDPANLTDAAAKAANEAADVSEEIKLGVEGK